MIQFDLFTGTALRDRGMKCAVTHANKVNDGWSDQAYSFLVDYIRSNSQPFMTEDVREASRGIVPVPPSLRSWGLIIRKAAMNGMIEKMGHGTVKNVTAHACFASKWKRV